MNWAPFVLWLFPSLESITQLCQNKITSKWHDTTKHQPFGTSLGKEKQWDWEQHRIIFQRALKYILQTYHQSRRERVRVNKKNKQADQGFEVVIDLLIEHSFREHYPTVMYIFLKVIERPGAGGCGEKELSDHVQRAEFGNILVCPANNLIER